MPNNRKFYAKDAVLFITSSTEEGLPFIPNMIINAILEGIIARAQFLYGQELCHYTFMSNHFHKIVRVTNPQTISDFIGYIKAKSADAINRMLGRKKYTVWCDGFDSPIVLTKESAIEKIIYTYVNPAKARLVDSIEQYPGLTSWKAYQTGKATKAVLWIKPSTIKRLPSVDMSYSEQLNYLAKLKGRNGTYFDLAITPDAWISTFKASSETSQINAKIISEVKAKEEELITQGPAMGAEKLRKQPLNLKHQREKHGQRMICLSTVIGLRASFIEWFKIMSGIAKDIFLEAQYKTSTKAFPPGFCGPGRTLHANYINFTPSVWA